MVNGLKQMHRKHVGWYMNGAMRFGNTVRGKEQACAEDK